ERGQGGEPVGEAEGIALWLFDDHRPCGVLNARPHGEDGAAARIRSVQRYRRRRFPAKPIENLLLDRRRLCLGGYLRLVAAVGDDGRLLVEEDGVAFLSHADGVDGPPERLDRQLPDDPAWSDPAEPNRQGGRRQAVGVDVQRGDDPVPAGWGPLRDLQRRRIDSAADALLTLGVEDRHLAEFREVEDVVAQDADLL